MYEHLSEHERYVICHMHMAGHKNADIARKLKRNPGSISRELKRNCVPYSDGHYLYDTAQRLANERRSAASRRYKLDDSSVGQYVRDGLQNKWSPEQIVGRLSIDHPNDEAMTVMHETIYQWIYRCAARGEDWHQHLRRVRRRRRRRIPGGRKHGQFPGRVDIADRPTVVDTRQRFGDWESDTMQGAKGCGALATHVERRSRYTAAGKLDDQRAETFARVTVRCMKHLPANLRRTATVDNGKEFARFKQIEKRLGMTIYFAQPYAAWQRGTNENTNGLLRQFFPKGTDFGRVSHQQVAKTVRMLNNRPRKCLNYRTPAEVLSTIPGVALRN